jgi:hypothetical protein
VLVEEPPRPFTLQETKWKIKKLNSKKAPGVDLITVKMLKELPEKTVKALMHLFSAIIRVAYWPLKLKTAQVITVLKPEKDPTHVESYRPISPLPTISKLLDKLVHKVTRGSRAKGMDARPSIRIPPRSLYRSTMSSHNRCNQQSHRK